MNTIVKKCMTLFAVGAILSAASACSVYNGSESSGEYVDDATITAKVKAHILDEESLKGFQIHVETYQGTVQLSGFVTNEYNKQTAENIAHNVKGVKGVRDDLIIR